MYFIENNHIGLYFEVLIKTAAEGMNLSAMTTKWILIYTFRASFVMLLLYHSTEAVKYSILKNKSYTTGSLLYEEVDISRRHCAKLCEAQAACEAAEYDRTTSSCRLLESPLPTVTQHESNDIILEVGGEQLHALEESTSSPSG